MWGQRSNPELHVFKSSALHLCYIFGLVFINKGFLYGIRDWTCCHMCPLLLNHLSIFYFIFFVRDRERRKALCHYPCCSDSFCLCCSHTMLGFKLRTSCTQGRHNTGSPSPTMFFFSLLLFVYCHQGCHWSLVSVQWIYCSCQPFSPF